MHNTQAIGIFDSGVGGLSVLKEIRQHLPAENLIYVADSAYAPYGNKSHEFILERSHALTRFLIDQDIKAIVIACNTATTISVAELRKSYNLPFVAMEPGVKPAIAATKSGVVGVMATENTLTSDHFTQLVHRYAENVRVINQPCHGLVEQIEKGEMDSQQTVALVTQYLRPLVEAGADTIVLGCTHYPLIRETIRRQLESGISIIDTGQAVAQQLGRVLENHSLGNQSSEPGQTQYWSSGDTHLLHQLLSEISTPPDTIRQL